MPEPVAMAVAVGTVGVAKAGYDVAVPILKNRFNGRAHTEKGGKHMDEAIHILTDPDLSANMILATRQFHLKAHQALQPSRHTLQESTSTIVGSILHSNEARAFHARAKTLHHDSRMASDSARVANGLDEVERQTKAHVLPKKTCGRAGNEPRERPLDKGNDKNLLDTLPQEIELEMVEGQNAFRAQGQFDIPEFDKAGRSVSAAEAGLRTILSPGGKYLKNHPLAT